jgi:hypothetical protein
MIPDYHYFTTGSAFGEIDQPPTRSALLRAKLARLYTRAAEAVPAEII